VVATYNIPGVTQELNFTLGRWLESCWEKSRSGTTKELTRSNPGVTMPANDIVVVHRSEGSGTTFVWTIIFEGQPRVEEQSRNRSLG